MVSITSRLVVLSLLAALSAFADDWPQFRGEAGRIGDGVYAISAVVDGRVYLRSNERFHAFGE